MGFKEAIITVLNNYANFSGRARRSEYWYFVLFTSIVTGVLSILGGNPENGRNILAFTPLGYAKNPFYRSPNPLCQEGFRPLPKPLANLWQGA